MINGLFAEQGDRIIDLQPSFPIPQRPEQAFTLAEKVAYLLSNDHQFLETTAILRDLEYDLPVILHLAFEQEDTIALLDVHKTLYQIYEVYLSHPLSPVCLHEHSPWLLTLRNQLETAWLNYEISIIKKQLPNPSEAKNSKSLCAWFLEQAQQESAIDKGVLIFFKNQASIEQFNLFLLSDATLNYRFFDALALGQLYFSEIVKTEITNNMWDECGNGVENKSHTKQFTLMLTKLGLQPPQFPVWDDWHPYAGYNLYFCFGLNRKHYFKSLGSLAMPELFDPNRNRAIITGLERLYFDARIKCEYFYNHIETEEEHGSRWLNNIIAPLVEMQPEAGIELAIGGALRMEAMRRYNEYLALKFGLFKHLL
ncbi:hypothetical protein Cri9333_0473 [Crinalium epipsammum PCC 9333]|uniref:Iron-containing redox enzyme family protein n=1 Tax=Crinalium epipsammum PCC 9333 TaxID=1173022 RepID=K9VV50_9CYAN|nr:iron-containing redox enzyme family protein [Crinalium epipsammum]AFZ11439.1 hypothetical protein Cri9333_0473 [Crinalium epipsammum PCC 9333]